MTQTELLRYLFPLLEESGIEYMLTGSFASGLYGEPRLTLDIDLVVVLSKEQVPGFLKRFSPVEFYSSDELVYSAIKNHSLFNILHIASGNKIDLKVREDNEYARVEFSRRRRLFILSNLEGWVAAPEDVIINKMRFYREGGSEKHLRDITGIIKVSKTEIDMAYINEWAEKIQLMEVWNAVLQKLNLIEGAK